MVSYENSFYLIRTIPSTTYQQTKPPPRLLLGNTICIMHFCCTFHYRINSNVTKFPCRVPVGHCVSVFFLLATDDFSRRLMVIFKHVFFCFSKNRSLDFSRGFRSFRLRGYNFSSSANRADKAGSKRSALVARFRDEKQTDKFTTENEKNI